MTNAYPTPEEPSFGVVVRDQVESLRMAGVEVDVLFVNGRRNRIDYLWGIPRLWIKLMGHRYDLIHAHHVYSGIIARTQFLCPVVLTHHGYEVFMTRERFLCRMMTPLVDKVILVSREQKERLGAGEAHVIPCGIDLRMFSPMPREEARQRLGLPKEKKLVLWAGEHFRSEKRFDIVRAAVALAYAEDPDIELVSVSGQPHEVLPLYMNACDVLLLVSDAEGSPMVVKEAMACNLAIVSCPTGDVPNVIEGVDGCCVCTQQPADVADKLLRTLDQPRRTLGREAIHHLAQDRVARRIIEQYHDVLLVKGRWAWLRPRRAESKRQDGPSWRKP